MFLITCLSIFFFERYGDHRDLHVLTHSFPTRRSSDLDPAGLASWSGLVAELAQVASLPDVREALTDPRLVNTDRTELFVGLIKTPISGWARNFVELLIDNHRILVLPQIAEQFEVLQKQREGTALAQNNSAFALDDKRSEE